MSTDDPPCSDCGARTADRSACPLCGTVLCQACAEKPYESCCDRVAEQKCAQIEFNEAQERAETCADCGALVLGHHGPCELADD